MAQCEVCGNEVVQGRGRARRTCSAACRQKAHRQRQAGQLAELRKAATGTALTLVPPAGPAVPAADDNSPAGRIRAAGAELAGLIDLAAWRAANGWTSHEVNSQFSIASGAEDNAAVIRMVAEEVVAAVLASAPEVSRNEPIMVPPSLPAPAAAAVPASLPAGEPAAVPEPSRDEPAAGKAAAPARRKRLSPKAARAVADSAQLVKDPDYRENHRWNLVAEDGTVLGHVEPSYGGGGRSGRNGWKYRDTFTGLRSSGHPYKTRDGAAVQCALSWMRMATAPVPRTGTGH